MREITVKLKHIGNSVGFIIPEEELKVLGKTAGDSIKIKIIEDDLEKEITEFFAQNGPIEEGPVFQDSDSTLGTLKDEWVWK